MARVHVALGSTTRRAYAGVPGDPRKTTAFLQRALRWFGPHGIGAERVMTDNARVYRSRRIAKALHWAAIRPFTRPCTPKTNAKAGRFIQTLLREWPMASRLHPRTHAATTCPADLPGSTAPDHTQRLTASLPPVTGV